MVSIWTIHTFCHILRRLWDFTNIVSVCAAGLLYQKLTTCFIVHMHKIYKAQNLWVTLLPMFAGSNKQNFFQNVCIPNGPWSHIHPHFKDYWILANHMECVFIFSTFFSCVTSVHGSHITPSVGHLHSHIFLKAGFTLIEHIQILVTHLHTCGFI